MSLYRRKSSPKWYGEYTDAAGKRIQKSTGTTVKRDAQAILLAWQTEANNQRQGLMVSPTVTLEQLLAEYLRYIGNSSAIHLSVSEARVRRVLDSCGLIYPREIDRIRIENVIRDFTTPNGEPISLRTQGHYIGACKSFTKWLTNLRGALSRDPLAGIKKPNFERDRKKTRRYLTPEEWNWLRQTPNALLYETAIQTGLRSSEIRCVTQHDIKTDHILLSGQHTKNGQPAKQYISQELAKRLTGNLPFDMPPIDDVAGMFYADLAAARNLWLETNPPKKLIQSQEFLCRKNDRGESLDFHALRHTCGAWLAIAGVGIKVIQTIMRHSTITLTLDTYGHLLPGQEQEGAEKLSALLTQSLR